MASCQTFTVIKYIESESLLPFPAEKGLQYFPVGGVCYNYHFNWLVRVIVDDLIRVIIQDTLSKSKGKQGRFSAA